MVANQQPQITPLPEVERIVRENGPRILSQMTDVLRKAWGLNPELTEYEVKTAEIIPLSRIPLTKDVKGADDLSKVLEENNIFGYVVPALRSACRYGRSPIIAPSP